MYFYFLIKLILVIFFIENYFYENKLKKLSYKFFGKKNKSKLEMVLQLIIYVISKRKLIQRKGKVRERKFFSKGFWRSAGA